MRWNADVSQTKAMTYIWFVIAHTTSFEIKLASVWSSDAAENVRIHCSKAAPLASIAMKKPKPAKMSPTANIV
jgi:hypothetical protein